MLTNHSICTGCNACGSICPRTAISLIQDEEGFYYPLLDEKKCINCQLCVKVCPVTKDKELIKSREAFMGFVKNDDLLFNSSSGGIVSYLYKELASEGFIVYGAKYSHDYYQVLMSKSDQTEIQQFLKSKYIEGKMAEICKNIGEDLLKGEKVVFCGTPCQVSGVRTYLNTINIQQDKLYLIDFVCHGVPSQRVWEAYLKKKETDASSKCNEVVFRSKKYGWDYSSCIDLKFENRKSYSGDLFSDLYYRLFTKRIIHRPSCTKCQEIFQSSADLTVGDYLGADAKLRNRYRKGLSVILLNTDKSKVLFRKINKEVFIEKLDDKDIAYLYKTKNVALEERKKFFDEFSKNSDSFFEQQEIYSINKLHNVRSNLMKNRVCRNIIEWIYKIRK